MKQFFSIFFLFGFLLQIHSQDENSKIHTAYKFEQIINKIEQLYVDSVNTRKLTETAIVALLEELDPHSTYIPKKDANDARSQIDGSFVGIGIRFNIVKDTILVVGTISGGPSEKLGILPGDKIIKVDEETVAGIGIKNSGVRSRLLGEKDSKVHVSIKRNGSNALIKFTIKRDKIPIFSVDASYMIDEKTGYIKLNSFSRTSTREMQYAISKLKKEGMKKLILDLQDNGGGLLSAAQDIADEFLSDDKLIVYSEGRSQPRSNLRAGKKGLWEKGELIILVNEYTASASEIVSGAVQDWDRGIIVGRRTFGKGLVQRPMRLLDGSEMRLTIARYYTPSGRFIQKPYENVKSYKNDITERFLNGELMHADSVKLPDSLRFSTLIKKRDVYSGGGITPDYFVPIDTSDISEYFKKINRGGHLNGFALKYVNENRKNLNNKFSNFSLYKKEMIVDDQLIEKFKDYVSSEDSSIIFNKEDYKISEQLIKTRLKGNIALNLWGYAEFYEVFNDRNEELQEALKLLQSKKDLFKN